MRTNNYNYALDLSLKTLLQAKLLAELNRTIVGLDLQEQTYRQKTSGHN